LFWDCSVELGLVVVEVDGPLLESLFDALLDDDDDALLDDDEPDSDEFD